MERIADKNKLPKWFFEKDRYSWLQDASLQHLAEQLTIRRSALFELKNGASNTEHMSLIENNYRAFESKKDISEKKTHLKGVSNPLNTDVVQTISAGGVLLMAQCINPDILTSKKWHLDYSHCTEGFIAQLSIRDFTDAEIIDTLIKVLPIMRKKLEMPAPQHFRMDNQIQKLRTGGVFEYLDLFFWAAYNNKSIHNELYATVIKPGSYTSDYISNKLKVNAEAMLTLRFSDLLEMKIDNIL